MQKICIVCGKDVSAIKRVKDPRGQYYYEPCHAALARRAAAHTTASDDAPDLDLPDLAADVPLDLSDLDLAPVLEPTSISPTSAKSAWATAVAADGPLCPCCNRHLTRNAKICTDCGIRVPSGRPMITSLGRDENMLYANAETIIRAVAWIIPLGWSPIASEAYAARKPIVTWIVAAITIVISFVFFIDMRCDMSMIHWMLWPPTPVHIPAHIHDPIVGEFHGYQLLTSAFLHDFGNIFGFVMHLGGNMLFLLIFGTRVNALIGNLKMAILYPLLGIAAAAAHLHFGEPSGPMLGASGAIMGLAGMYLIFFPAHRVYMAIWLKLFWWYPAWLKIWTVRGFWVLVFYISFDVIATILRSSDGVAHWAHLGGFIAGTAAAILLLVSGLANARHGDLLSVLLGKYAWPLIGKPR
ncbi:MAG: rhomboid family intramembrane serine protease [Phycisphaerales bacterium]|nr:rhomboid family intramembrane serine protease [Phycisphaerales bacterium]